MRKLIITAATMVGACLATTARAQELPVSPPVPVSPLVSPRAPHAALAPTAEYVPAPSPLPNVGLLATGALVFAGTYGASAFVAYSNNTTWDSRLYYPVVGPWLDLGGRDCAFRQCSASGWDKVLLVGDGVLQAAGVATMIAGLFVPSTVTRGAFFFVGANRVGVAGSF